MPAAAEQLRIATWHAPLTRKGPGLLLSDLLRQEAPDLTAKLSGIDGLEADVLLLTDIDFDHGLAALGALNDALDRPFPHLFALRPNTGMQTGRDLDGNGATGEPRDAQGYGWFAGEGGMALLSRVPLGAVTELSALLWADLPGSLMALDDPGADIQRLSTSGHWIVPLDLPGGQRLTLLAFHATPPVFDGPEDRNGRRNHDEVALWLHLLEGRLPHPAPDGPLVILGNANLDLLRGQGRRAVIAGLLADPRLQDPMPDRPTAFWPDGPGALRFSYILPSPSLAIAGAGQADAAADTGPHRPIWVDLSLPEPVEGNPPDS